MDKEKEQMTDEQIEQALKNRAYEISYGDHNDKWIIPKDRLSQETLSYIDRLKETGNSAVRSFTRMETLYKLKCNELETAEANKREFAEELSEIKHHIRDLNVFLDDECRYILEEAIDKIDELLAEVTGE